MCGDFIEYRVSISSVVMIFNYIQDEATNSRCAELIVVCVYCGGGGDTGEVVMNGGEALLAR